MHTEVSAHRAAARASLPGSSRVCLDAGLGLSNGRRLLTQPRQCLLDCLLGTAASVCGFVLPCGEEVPAEASVLLRAAFQHRRRTLVACALEEPLHDLSSYPCRAARCRRKPCQSTPLRQFLRSLARHVALVLGLKLILIAAHQCAAVRTARIVTMAQT